MSLQPSALNAEPHTKTYDSIFPGTAQKVVLSTSSAQSAALGAATSIVIVCADVDCWILTGANPTALLTSTYCPAKVPQRFGVAPGSKIAGIAGGAGNLYITEGA
jgi:hypothetical protein